MAIVAIIIIGSNTRKNSITTSRVLTFNFGFSDWKFLHALYFFLPSFLPFFPLFFLLSYLPFLFFYFLFIFLPSFLYYNLKISEETALGETLGM